ncbi:hypothetical protein KRX19_00260 [Cardiobacteriaceae bacterium TAE3-ERU3]|nr:hypothetical protein [Cardiobacteriaceae bacterium TAE3-ERU3]
MSNSEAQKLRQPFTEQEANYVAELRDSCLGLILSCGDNQLSHAPFVFQDGCYYIFISTLAARTKALLADGRGQIMLLKDESATGNIYSRRRMTQPVRAETISRNHTDYQALLDALQTRHGKTVELLRGLGDFHLIRLIPEGGQLILGFGKSFDIPENC